MKNPLVPAKSNVAMGAGNTWWLDVKEDEFVHFTTASRADLIVTTGKMLLRPAGIKHFGVAGVHGISTTYGRYVPRTQVTHIDSTPTDPTVAVVFRTNTVPKIGFVEEVVWDRDVALSSVRIVPQARGVALIGVSPANIDENDIVVYSADQRPTTSTAERVLNRLAKEIDLGAVSVDSGTIMLLDPAYADSWETGEHPELSYDSVTDPNWSRHRQLHFAPGAEAGVIVKTMYGDGTYPVTGEVDEKGRVESVTVRFTSNYPTNIVTAAKPRYKGKSETEKGNIVYHYSERQIANRNKGKAKRLEKLRTKIGDVRKQVSKDLKSDDPETFLTALAVALIDETYERVGNSESADESGHFGVTGWQRGHVSFSKGKATIRYTGKAGVKHEKTIDNGQVVKALRDAYEGVEGDEACLFAPEGMTIDARKVNAYLKSFDITAKDLRGFHANRVMQECLRAARKAGGKLPADKKEREKKLKDEFKDALEETAEAVGHEAATLASNYLVPGTREAYLEDGTVMSSMDKTASVLLRYLAAMG